MKKVLLFLICLFTGLGLQTNVLCEYPFLPVKSEELEEADRKLKEDIYNPDSNGYYGYQLFWFLNPKYREASRERKSYLRLLNSGVRDTSITGFFVRGLVYEPLSCVVRWELERFLKEGTLNITFRDNREGYNDYQDDFFRCYALNDSSEWTRICKSWRPMPITILKPSAIKKLEEHAGYVREEE